MVLFNQYPRVWDIFLEKYNTRIKNINDAKQYNVVFTDVQRLHDRNIIPQNLYTELSNNLENIRDSQFSQPKNKEKYPVNTQTEMAFSAKAPDEPIKQVNNNAPFGLKWGASKVL